MRAISKRLWPLWELCGLRARSRIGPRCTEGEHRQRVSLPTYPFERKRYWLESIAGLGETSSRPAAGSTLRRESSKPNPKSIREQKP